MTREADMIEQQQGGPGGVAPQPAAVQAAQPGPAGQDYSAQWADYYR